MPIRPELKYLYPIDWPQVSKWVRFVRAQGRCERCGRPHGEIVRRLDDGRWWDDAQATWRDGSGRKAPCPGRRCTRACDQGRACGSPPRPQPFALRPPAPQHQRVVPEMSPAARPRRTSPPNPSHAAQASSNRGSLLGSLPLLVTLRNGRPSTPRNLQLSDRQARSRGPSAATLGGCSPIRLQLSDRQANSPTWIASWRPLPAA